jgi:hypothetical protein
MTTKKCKDCKQEKPLSDYYKDKITPDGHAYRCKPCNNLKVKKYKKLHPEKDKEYDKKKVERKPDLYKKIRERANKKFKEKYHKDIDKSRRLARENYYKYAEKYRVQSRDKYNSNEGRNRFLIRKYGITLEEFNQMLFSQQNACKICKTKFTTRKSIHTDHCHKIGKVRGLLCSACNVTLGQMKDNITYLKNMIKYLEKSNPLQYKIKL